MSRSARRSRPERRPIHVAELAEFSECGACGTAAVISPIGKIVDVQGDGKEYVFSKNGEAGEISKKLYERLLGIQYGMMEDKFNWITIIE